MDEFSSLQNLRALSDLLSRAAGGDGDDDDDEDWKNESLMTNMGPGQIGTPSTSQSHKNAVKNTNSIWELEEVTEVPQVEDLADPRPRPEYEIILQQSVGTEDFFLDLSRKDPSSMCCESMLVRVKLPETQASDVVLDVKERFVDLRTPKYKLGLHLPQAVHSGAGTARFITERNELEITLPMNKHLDI